MVIDSKWIVICDIAARLLLVFLPMHGSWLT